MISYLRGLGLIRQRRIKVTFIYNAGYRDSGTTVMRVYQLAEILREHVGSHLEVSYKQSLEGVRGSIVILNKNAIRMYGVGEINKARKNNKVLVDPIDAILSSDIAENVDGVIAASRIAFEEWNSNLKVPVFLINHHADPRIKEGASQGVFRAGYFGELDNTLVTPRIRKRVDFISISTQKQESEWLTLIHNYNLHYSIRRRKNHDGYKPFTKGFTAAICRSNIIVGSDDKEALVWLGEDYPYICRDLTENGILRMIDYAESTYQGAEWQKGLHIMEGVRQELSYRNIADQFLRMTQEVASR